VPGVISIPDANLWLALAYSGHIHHPLALAWFEQCIGGSTAFVRFTQLALLRHLTNRTIMGSSTQSQRGAWNTYLALAADERVLFVAEPEGLEAGFQQLTNSDKPSHRNWSDAYLAAFAKTGGFRIVTFDRDFEKLFESRQLTIL
jgi:uncharacterized protein